MARFQDRRVLVTGAAAGIGRSTAEAFAREGATLVLTDVNAQGLEATAEALRQAGARVRTFVVDVGDREQVAAMAEALLREAGPPDVLVNNAGVGWHGQLVDTTPAEWERLLRVNLWGVLHHVDAFLPAMRARRAGHIVNISSGQAFFRLPTWGAYAAVKAAVGIYSEVLHFELKRHGIRVTTVYPFMVNTGFYREVESHSLGSRLSMRLLPLYSQRPETVGRIVVRAVARRRRVEMVNVVNDLGYYMRLVPPLADAVSALTCRVLAPGDS